MTFPIDPSLLLHVGMGDAAPPPPPPAERMRLSAAWMTARGLKGAPKPFGVCRLIGSGRCRGLGRRGGDCIHVEFHKLGRVDHSDFFTKGGKPYAFVYQPYAHVTKADWANVQQFAADHGLSARWSAEESWHFPGRTILIELTKLGVSP